MEFGSLFSGIGGIDLGFERAGMICKWQVEIDDYCRKVLHKHWPHVSKYTDIRELATDGDIEHLRVDVIAGGFPCQDISYAGRGAGLDGERSGLFFEAIRVVRQLRPRIVVLENVAALLTRGLDQVLGALAEIGFDAEWDCLPASAFGAHFRRDRVFIVAHRAEPHCLRRQGEWKNPARAFAEHEFKRLVERELQLCVPAGKGQRVSDGISSRVDRLRGIGNAVVPQVAEWIGRRIMLHAARHNMR